MPDPDAQKNSRPRPGVAVLISDTGGRRFRYGDMFAKIPDPERSRLHSAMVRVNQPSLV